MDAKNINLRPDWNLLDSTFESYKLSLQQLPVYHVNPDCELDTVTLANDDFSYNRTKVLSLHNYLFGDPWNEKECYFVDKAGHIKRLSVIVEASIGQPRSVFQLGSHFLQTERHMPVTISFPSANLCLISDGAGLVYLLDTGNRQTDTTQKTKWTILLSGNIVGENSEPSVLLCSRQHFEDAEPESGDHGKKDVIDILTLRFQDEKKDDAVISQAVVEWTWLFRYDEKSKFEIGGHRMFKGKQAPFYATLGESGKELFIGSHSPMKYATDWEQQVLSEEMEIENGEAADKMDSAPENSESLYKWTQTDEDVTVMIPMPEGADKTSVVYGLSKSKLTVGFKDATGKISYVLDGKLFVEVDHESSNWSVEGQTLTVTISKELEGQNWPIVILGDTSGQMIPNNADQDVDMETKDEMADLEARGFQPTGLDHYEDCDDLPDADSMLYMFDATENKFTYEAGIASNQWLFNCYYNHKLCTVLRHDIDALVWESDTPSESCSSPWKHVATFNALGYVRASKEDVKYSGCSPNASYSALCESSSRVFVYHSPTTTAAPLKNRKTGKSMHVSKQQVVSLPSNEPILGFHASSELMFVLTGAKIFIIKVTAPDT
uniref:nudC domain-containing protein 1-like n=1 Tax=Styela clava TaxID=7725 RepID=UPI00193958FA|nr:nudC domain-containing protein 1-like [Styela clava]